MRDFFGLRDRVAMVVGGGQGMGEAAALNYAQAGAHVAVIDIDLDRAERVAARVRALDRKAVAICVDALDETTAVPTVDEVERALGGLDVMATIIGQAEWRSVLEMTPETWDLDHRRNLRYFFFYAQAAANAMVRAGRPGAITAVASVSGIQSAPNHASYGAAKAGLMNLVRTMAVELAPHGIRVNAIAPGTIRTPRLQADPERAQAFAERIRNSLLPMRRQGEPQNIADAILFMSSELATYVTGQTLAVDGGWTAQFLIGAPRE